MKTGRSPAEALRQLLLLQAFKAVGWGPPGPTWNPAPPPPPGSPQRTPRTKSRDTPKGCPRKAQGSPSDPRPITSPPTHCQLVASRCYWAWGQGASSATEIRGWSLCPCLDGGHDTPKSLSFLVVVVVGGVWGSCAKWQLTLWGRRAWEGGDLQPPAPPALGRTEVRHPRRWPGGPQGCRLLQ